ncbi:cyclic-phosphate processing receiver domain-containing protein [Paenibacillus lutrae]|uniref:Cell division protein FtsJ n=1 Tax=Paenibacillus lutrae TaxID=2078573 RepID=A0A7X3FII1_9BACL|nr:cyclic-phosphate processing receiver domain-containing protein [Paenibacillus lutrae]MVP00404.1 cell division protein FtsJ [Paenibacillus lutrae]
MIHVFLDDQRRCPAGFTLARTIAECKLLLEECEVDILSLDYDLGGEESGWDLVAWMIAARRYPGSIYLHTSSMEGRSRMYQALYASKPETVNLHAGPPPTELLERLAAAL